MNNQTIEKQNLINEYLDNYEENDMINFCQVAINKYRFEKYKIKNLNRQNIDIEDYIIDRDSEAYNLMLNIINNQRCNQEDFANILELLDYEQIIYIGF